MSFYGNITNVNNTTFTFDKVYPNKNAMVLNAKTDGVYIGRYVLIEYDNNGNTFLQRFYINDEGEFCIDENGSQIVLIEQDCQLNEIIYTYINNEYKYYKCIGAFENGQARFELISNSDTDIKMAPEVAAASKLLEEFMFSAVYTNPVAKSQEHKAEALVKALYEFFLENANALPAEYQAIAMRDGLDRAVCDYISGMSDRYAIKLYNDFFVPKGWSRE